jgi:hypothetical protein
MVIVFPAVTVKGKILKALTHPISIAIGPVVVPVGTMAVILVELLAVTNAGTPLKVIVLFSGVLTKICTCKCNYRANRPARGGE